MRDPSSRTALARGLVLWVALLAACTLVLWLFRGELPEAHMALAYLLLVLGGSARHGRWLGTMLAVAAFLLFNFFLLPPFYTFAIEDPLDWWILIAFLVTGGVAAQLFHRAQRAVAMAERRAREIERLSAVGAESLSGARAVDAVRAIARVIKGELAIAQVQIFMEEAEGGEPTLVAAEPSEGRLPPPTESLRLVLSEGRLTGVREDGSHVYPKASDLEFLVSDGAGCVGVLVPLQVHDRRIGVLHLGDPSGIRIDRHQAQFGDTLRYYAALAVERVRLASAAESVAVLREADRLKDAFLASVSHDLRTPLTTIRALGAELRSTGDDRALVIEEEAERLNRLVTDLLDLSRIRSGGLPLAPEVVAAEDLVGAALQRLRGVPRAEDIQVRLPPGGELLLGRFDFAHTLRALVNLLENALRHSPPLIPVELAILEEGDTLILRVMDRGPGIRETHRERIFEPFHSGTDGGGRASPGTGLGLAIARSVAEAQGGGIVLRSREGGGSTFDLRLPAARLEESTEVPGFVGSL